RRSRCSDMMLGSPGVFLRREWLAGRGRRRPPASAGGISAWPNSEYTSLPSQSPGLGGRGRWVFRWPEYDGWNGQRYSVGVAIAGGSGPRQPLKPAGRRSIDFTQMFQEYPFDLQHGQRMAMNGRVVGVDRDLRRSALEMSTARRDNAVAAARHAPEQAVFAQPADDVVILHVLRRRRRQKHGQNLRVRSQRIDARVHVQQIVLAKIVRIFAVESLSFADQHLGNTN